MSSIFIDANYFLRFFLDDNNMQTASVKTLFKQAALEESVVLYTSTIVFFEVFWVLHSFYKQSKEQCIYFLDGILKLTFITMEERAILASAMDLWTIHSIELEDCYNLCKAASFNCSEFASFDQKVVRLANKTLT